MKPYRGQYYTQFDPRHIVGCQAWLDGADSNSMTFSGTNITQWNDKSGNGNNAASIVSALSVSTPTYNGTSLNGRTTVSFGNSNDALRINNNFNMTQFPSLCYFIVIRPASSQQNATNAGILSTDNSGQYGRSLGFGSGNWQVEYYNNFQNITAYTANAWAITSLQFNSTTSTTLAVNGTTYAGTASATKDNTNGLHIGTYNNGDGTGYNLYNANFDTAEILIYGVNLSTAERQTIEGYLAWKWGLQSNLPGTHPYRYVPMAVRPIIPPDIGVCEFWFDAADSSTVTATGTTLNTWSNKGTTIGSNATTGAGTVTWGSVTQQNGMNLVGMGGGAYAQATMAFPTAVRTRFFATRPTVNQNTSLVYLLFQGAGGGRDTIALDGLNNSGRLVELAQSVAFTMITSGTLASQSNVFGLYTFRNASTTGSNRIAFNGSNMALSTSAVASGYPTGALATYLGSNTDMGEWISYNSQLTDSQVAQVEGYLAWKWGLQGSLPSTHAFRRLPPFVSTFSPTQITGCILWWDSSDKDQFTGGTTWGDKSGSNNTGINGTPGASTMPTAARWTNGNQVARFVAGSKNSVKTTNTIPNLNVTYFMVARIQAAIGTGYFMINNIDGQRQMYTTGTTFPAPVTAHASSASSIQVASLNQSQPIVYAATVVTGASGFVTYTNGTANAVRATSNSSASVHYFGSANGDSGYASIDIGEIIIYNTVLSTTNRQQVEGYLAHKWDVPGNLPATHPYREIKP